jgi:isoquinoline 1-oxidoreductase beta subunit
MRRREFLKLSGLVGGGLLVSVVGPKVQLLGRGKEAQRLGTHIRLMPDGRTFIKVYKQEMGQGILTGLAMVAAEEMEADWDLVTIEQPSFDRNSIDMDLEHGAFETGGSYSMQTQRDPMREAGATVRELLRLGAAEHWGIAVRHSPRKGFCDSHR